MFGKRPRREAEAQPAHEAHHFGKRKHLDDELDDGDSLYTAAPDPVPTSLAEAPAEEPAAPGSNGSGSPPAGGERLRLARTRIFATLAETVDLVEFSRLGQDQMRAEIARVVDQIIVELGLVLSAGEEAELIRTITDDALGLGPLESLLTDDAVTDIMVNRPDCVYIERNGRLERSDVRFRDVDQLMNICTRIATSVGRRVDEASPICDARLPDGSRVNVVIPPLSMDSPMLTIRRFRKRDIMLSDMVAFGTLTADAASFLAVAAGCRTNILISGGTGSGKTTLLNALSREIDPEERIITVEDTAELRLQQPHVGRLETRVPNIEGKGEVTQRDLVRNCLRMRPDRIIVGEVRGAEAFDMLQAMNTGHAGSMSTVHSNAPRDALTRLEDMVFMTNFDLPSGNVQRQIASAIELIIQIERMRDGQRRVTDITEVVGFREGMIVLQDLFVFEQEGIDAHDRIIGSLHSTGLRPGITRKAAKYGREQEMLEAVGVGHGAKAAAFH